MNECGVADVICIGLWGGWENFSIPAIIWEEEKTVRKSDNLWNFYPSLLQVLCFSWSWNDLSRMEGSDT